MGSLKVLKEKIKNPLLLHNFEVFISDDPDGRIALQTRTVTISPGLYDVGTYKLGDRVIPYFVGKKAEPITFTMAILESDDGYVSSYFDSLNAALYSSNGLININKLQGSLKNVFVYQLDQANNRRIKYSFTKCLFIEETDLSFSHSSEVEPQILSYTVYARGMTREVIKPTTSSTTVGISGPEEQQ